MTEWPLAAHRLPRVPPTLPEPIIAILLLAGNDIAVADRVGAEAAAPDEAGIWDFAGFVLDPERLDAFADKRSVRMTIHEKALESRDAIELLSNKWRIALLHLLTTPKVLRTRDLQRAHWRGYRRRC